MPKPIVGLVIAAHLVNPAEKLAWAVDGRISSLLIPLISIAVILLFAEIIHTMRRLATTALIHLVRALYNLLASMYTLLSVYFGGSQEEKRLEVAGSGEEELEGVIFRDAMGNTMMRVVKGDQTRVVCLKTNDSPFIEVDTKERLASPICGATSSPSPLFTLKPGPFTARPVTPTIPLLEPTPAFEELLIHLDDKEWDGATYTHTGRISSYRRRQLLEGDAIPTAIVAILTSQAEHISVPPSPTYSPQSSLFSSDEDDEPRTTGRFATLPWVPPAASTSYVPRVLTLNHGADSDEEDGPADRRSVSSELSHDSFDFEWAFEAQDAERRAAAESSVPLTPARASISTSPCVLTRPNSVGNALDAVLEEVNEKLGQA